jgi:predicted short-subunit dehydrogenase-like oxidoreductase (DUF2520 family)
VTARVFILGAGRAGRGLVRAFRASGVPVVGMHGRQAESGPEGRVSAGALPDDVRNATTILVTVRDGQLEAALSELALAPLAPGAVVLHASGSSEPAALDLLRAHGHPAGTFHPLVPLADPARAADMLHGAYVGVDGDAPAQAVARELAVRLGATPIEIPPGTKARYHAAAVIASNFPAVLFSLAERQLHSCGFAPDVARRALHPLLAGVVENLRAGTGAQALTGPVVRGDSETVRRHIEVLTADPMALDVYRAVSRAAIDLARSAGTEERALRDIADLLG